MNNKLYQFLFVAAVVFFSYSFMAEVKASLQIFPHIDKVVHFAIFFVLAAIMHRAFNIPVTAHLVLLVIYGGSIELLQSFTPKRQASWLDLLADSLGAVAYFAIYFAWRKRQTAKASHD